MTNKEQKSFKKIINHGLLAGLASFTSIFTYPFEVLKIRSQVIENQNFKKNLIRKMYRKEGLKSFYKGLHQNILHGFFGYGTVFFIYELFMKNLNSFNKNYFILNSIISSVSGGIVAVVITSPINFLKTRQILHKSEYNETNKSTLKFFTEIYKENKNIRGFWKALNPSLMTSFYSAIQISLYEFLKIKFDSKDRVKINSLLGLISRSVACTIIYPFALIRSRMLNKSKSFKNQKDNFYTSDYEYKKAFKDIISVINREGFLSLFKGLKFELVKVSINGALFFYFYEFLNKVYNN